MNLHDIADISKINCLIDLHLHLDGSLTLPIIKHLAVVEGIKLDETDEELLKKIQVSPNCKNLNEFLEKFDFPLTFLQTKEGIREAVRCVLDTQHNQGLMYAEIRFAPQLHLQRDLTMDEVVQAAIEGSKEASIPSVLILCMMRGADEKLNKETIDVAAKYLNKGVGGVDIAGAESLFPIDKYESLFKYAKELNIPYTIHAGEADIAKSVDTSLDFGAKRIGHGVRSVENQLTVKHIFDADATLELCPTSNIQTCVVDKIENFPLVELMESGIKVTINQDDPAIEGITLKSEYELLIKTFSLTYLEVKGFLLNSLNASFAPLALKVKLSSEIRETFNNLTIEKNLL